MKTTTDPKEKKAKDTLNSFFEKENFKKYSKLDKGYKTYFKLERLKEKKHLDDADIKAIYKIKSEFDTALLK